jgi:probable phosphomutase (TIGR03848 family)
VLTCYLIRHATCAPVGKAIAGWTPGVHLDEQGRVQAARLAERFAGLPLAGVFSSPLERARETAAPLAATLGLPVVTLDGVGEVRFGEWTGATLDALSGRADWHRWNRFRSVATPPGGELMLEVQARAVRSLEELRRMHRDGAVAIVSHADVIRAVIAHALGTPLDHLLRMEIGPASVSALRMTDESVQVLGVNSDGPATIWCRPA